MTEPDDLETAAKALEILVADGIPAEDGIDLVSACVRMDRDPVKFAHHLVELRKVWRTIPGPHRYWGKND